VEKGRYPDDLGMGTTLPKRRNSLAKKVLDQMAKGRRKKHQVFS
jgi:hypothetical protein